MYGIIRQQHKVVPVLPVHPPAVLQLGSAAGGTKGGGPVLADGRGHRLDVHSRVGLHQHEHGVGDGRGRTVALDAHAEAPSPLVELCRQQGQRIAVLSRESPVPVGDIGKGGAVVQLPPVGYGRTLCIHTEACRGVLTHGQGQRLLQDLGSRFHGQYNHIGGHRGTAGTGDVDPVAEAVGAAFHGKDAQAGRLGPDVESHVCKIIPGGPVIPALLPLVGEVLSRCIHPEGHGPELADGVRCGLVLDLGRGIDEQEAQVAEDHGRAAALHAHAVLVEIVVTVGPRYPQGIGIPPGVNAAVAVRDIREPEAFPVIHLPEVLQGRTRGHDAEGGVVALADGRIHGLGPDIGPVVHREQGLPGKHFGITLALYADAVAVAVHGRIHRVDLQLVGIHTDVIAAVEQDGPPHAVELFPLQEGSVGIADVHAEGHVPQFTGSGIRRLGNDLGLFVNHQVRHLGFHRSAAIACDLHLVLPLIHGKGSPGDGQ